MDVQLSQKDMAKQFLLDRARRIAYNKARQQAVKGLIHKYQPEYDETFIRLKVKQEGIELDKIRPQLEALGGS